MMFEVHESEYSLQFQQLWGEAVELDEACRALSSKIKSYSTTSIQVDDVKKLKHVLAKTEKLNRRKDSLNIDSEWIELTMLLNAIQNRAERALDP